MLDKSPLAVKNADMEAQLLFMFETRGTVVPGKVSVPIFWKYGVYHKTGDVAAATAEEERKNRTLARRLMLEEQALNRYEESLARDSVEFEKTLDARRKLYREKEAQLEMLNQRTLTEKRGVLLEREAEKKRLEQENAVAETERENQERLLALRSRHETAEQEILNRLSETDTAIAQEETRSAAIQTALDRVKSEFLDLNRFEIREKQANEKRVFEAFDPRNIMEVKEVYLYNVNRERYSLYLPTMSMRKNKVTVVTAKDAEVLKLAYKVLFRTYGTNLSMRSGEVRIDGVATTSVLKQDFKKTFGRIAVASADYLEEAQHSTKNALKTFSAEKEEPSLRNAVRILGGNPETVRKSLSKLTETERETLAYSAAFISKRPLVAFLTPFRKHDSEFNEGFISLLEKRDNGSAYLVLTTEKDLILKLGEFSLYRLE